MILADVNVRVHAFRLDSEDHEMWRTWLNSVVDGDSRYGVSPEVLSGVVRVTTHPKVFEEQGVLEEALRFCDVLLRQPHLRPFSPGNGTRKSSGDSAPNRTLVEIWRRTHGSRHRPSSLVANG